LKCACDTNQEKFEVTQIAEPYYVHIDTRPHTYKSNKRKVFIFRSILNSHQNVVAPVVVTQMEQKAAG
jgi:hypothetical protein